MVTVTVSSSNLLLRRLMSDSRLVGSKNRYCLCETCEKNSRGGYGPEGEASGCESDAGASDDDLSDSEPVPTAVGNVNERRTRRGVYAIIQEQDDDSDESDDEEKEGNKPLANASDVAEVDLDLGGDSTSSVPRSVSRRSASRFVSSVSTIHHLTLSCSS